MNDLKAYIRRLLGNELNVIPFDGVNGLPYLLQGHYDFFLGELNDHNFLLMCNHSQTALTPRAIAKHVELAREYTKLPVVYVAKSMVAYNRDRLLQRHVPFIIPGRQLYLPFLHAAFSESEAKTPKEFSDLGTLAQLLILGQLNHQFLEPLSIMIAQKWLPYSRVSVLRAFDELEFFCIAERRGASRHMEFVLSGKALWQTALPLLKNPCRRSIGLEAIPDNLSVHIAGISALSGRTMLADPRQTEYAIAVGEFNALKNIRNVPKADAPILLQLWTYQPILPGMDKIDPFSLFLTLKDDSDERVQIALDELMDGITW